MKDYLDGCIRGLIAIGEVGIDVAKFVEPPLTFALLTVLVIALLVLIVALIF